MNAEILRWILAGFVVVMFALAISYLMRRRLTPLESLLWGSFALLVPVLGPFLVIVARPGQRGRERSDMIRRRRTTY
jgi:hypothetical protein